MKDYISLYYIDNIAMRREQITIPKKKKLVLVTVHMPEAFLDGLEQLVYELKRYPSRSEAIRVAVRDLLLKHKYFTRKNVKIIG